MNIKNRILNCLLVVVLIFFSGCEKKPDHLYEVSLLINYGSVTDADGNSYRTYQIGTQTWMVENLKTTKYNDGTSIPIVPEGPTWSSITTPACCWQNNNAVRKIPYGALYNWYTVSTGKLCPEGWHVPGDYEWEELTGYLGGDQIAGAKLKEAGLLHWNSPNTGATNETYFWALPGGNRLAGPDAVFTNLFKLGGWWSSTSGGDMAFTRFMYDNSSSVVRSFNSKNWGLSVRCVWDY